MTAIEESRVEQNYHELRREVEYAEITFAAKLADALRAQLCDVEDAADPDEKYATVLEEILSYRLREIRRVLLAAGVDVRSF